MKIKTDFVTNSSSTSYIIISAGNKTIHQAGDPDSCEPDYSSMDIDAFIKQLQEAKAAGATKVDFEFGGGYEG